MLLHITTSSGRAYIETAQIVSIEPSLQGDKSTITLSTSEKFLAHETADEIVRRIETPEGSRDRD